MVATQRTAGRLSPDAARPRRARGATTVLVFIGHSTRWVELPALRRVDVTDVVACLLDKRVPQHSVPATLLSPMARSSWPPRGENSVLV